MPPRSRTGCLTCRLRKLKCGEERPICAQCIKANRECILSSGITFRHQQNPSMNAGQLGEGSLKNFYGYKETFARETTWMPVPAQLTFVHTNNPYEDVTHGADAQEGDSSFMTDMSGNGRYDDRGTGNEYELAQAVYPAYATHGLEALSAVASQDQYSYAPPPATMTQDDQQFSAAGGQNGYTATTQNLDFILNPTAGAASNIDPRLHSEGHAPQPARAESQAHQSPGQYPAAGSIEDQLLRAAN